MARFEVYQDEEGEWRWRLRATNGQLLADAGEGFASRASVFRSIEAVREAVAEAKEPLEVSERD